MENTGLENDGPNAQDWKNDRTGQNAIVSDGFLPGPVVFSALLFGPSFSSPRFYIGPSRFLLKRPECAT